MTFLVMVYVLTHQGVITGNQSDAILVAAVAFNIVTSYYSAKAKYMSQNK